MPCRTATPPSSSSEPAWVGFACAIDLAAGGFPVQLPGTPPPYPGGKARTARSEASTSTRDRGRFSPCSGCSRSCSTRRVRVSNRGRPGARRHPRASRVDGWRRDSTFTPDRQRTADAIAQLFGGSEGSAYLAFCRDGSEFTRLPRGALPSRSASDGGPHGETARRDALGAGQARRAPLHGEGSRAPLRLTAPAATLRALRDLLRGLSFEAPATLNLVAHVESEGVYRAREGVHGVVASLERLARSLGVEMLYGHQVDRIVVERQRATGVVCQEASWPPMPSYSTATCPPSAAVCWARQRHVRPRPRRQRRARSPP